MQVKKILIYGILVIILSSGILFYIARRDFSINENTCRTYASIFIETESNIETKCNFVKEKNLFVCRSTDGTLTKNTYSSDYQFVIEGRIFGKGYVLRSTMKKKNGEYLDEILQYDDENRYQSSIADVNSMGKEFKLNKNATKWDDHGRVTEGKISAYFLNECQKYPVQYIYLEREKTIITNFGSDLKGFSETCSRFSGKKTDFFDSENILIGSLEKYGNDPVIEKKFNIREKREYCTNYPK